MFLRVAALHELGELKDAAALYEQVHEAQMFRRAAAGLEKLDFAHGAARLIVHNLCETLEQRKQPD
jgi:hypothetical protein